VLHQLRGVLGDEVFFDVLRAYEARHRLGVAATEDFITAAEATSGQPLRWYFDPWVFLPEEPSWRWSWGAQPAGGGWQLDLAIAQDLPDFRVPTVARVRFADGTEEDVALDVFGEGLTVTLCRDAEPVEVTLDPDGWWPLVQAREVVGANAALTCGDEPDTGVADTATDAGTDDPADAVVADEDASEGCGCASGEAPSGLGALVLAGLMFRRRR
jgi:MYXO-CTERM domain-containing protein